MSTWQTRRIKKALLHKGFQEHQTHHNMFWLYANGKKTSVRTRLSHNVREYGDNLLALVAKQLHIDRNRLDDFIECPLTQEAYVDLLVQQGDLKLGC